MLSAAGGHAVPPAAVWGGVTHRDAVEVCPHSMLTAPRRREPAVCPQYGVCSRGRKPRGVPASRPVAVRPHAPGTGLQPARTPSSGHRTWGVTRRASVCIRLPRPAPWVPARSVHRVSSSRERVYLEGRVHLPEAVAVGPLEMVSGREAPSHSWLMGVFVTGGCWVWSDRAAFVLPLLPWC